MKKRGQIISQVSMEGHLAPLKCCTVCFKCDCSFNMPGHSESKTAAGEDEIPRERAREGKKKKKDLFLKEVGR